MILTEAEACNGGKMTALLLCVCAINTYIGIDLFFCGLLVGKLLLLLLVLLL